MAEHLVIDPTGDERASSLTGTLLEIEAIPAEVLSHVSKVLAHPCYELPERRAHLAEYLRRVYASLTPASSRLPDAMRLASEFHRNLSAYADYVARLPTFPVSIADRFKFTSGADRALGIAASAFGVEFSPSLSRLIAQYEEVGKILAQSGKASGWQTRHRFVWHWSRVFCERVSLIPPTGIPAAAHAELADIKAAIVLLDVLLDDVADLLHDPVLLDGLCMGLKLMYRGEDPGRLTEQLEPIGPLAQLTWSVYRDIMERLDRLTEEVSGRPRAELLTDPMVCCFRERLFEEDLASLFACIHFCAVLNTRRDLTFAPWTELRRVLFSVGFRARDIIAWGGDLQQYFAFNIAIPAFADMDLLLLVAAGKEELGNIEIRTSAVYNWVRTLARAAQCANQVRDIRRELRDGDFTSLVFLEAHQRLTKEGISLVALFEEARACVDPSLRSRLEDRIESTILKSGAIEAVYDRFRDEVESFEREAAALRAEPAFAAHLGIDVALRGGLDWIADHFVSKGYS